MASLKGTATFQVICYLKYNQGLFLAQALRIYLKLARLLSHHNSLRRYNESFTYINS